LLISDPNQQFRAGTYEPGMLRLWDTVLARFYENLPSRRHGTRLLDVGCGRGLLVSLARRDGLDAYGIEPYWPNPIDRHIVRGVAEQLPFDDAAFDLVTSFSVIEYVKEPAVALAEISRVLRPRGIAVLAVPELESYRLLRRDRYRHITSEAWLRALLPTVPALRLRSVEGLGVRYLVPLAKRTIGRVFPALAPRLIAAAYAHRYPRGLADLSICTLERA
jgi:SAM-dependent methyltransferase